MDQALKLLSDHLPTAVNQASPTERCSRNRETQPIRRVFLYFCIEWPRVNRPGLSILCRSEIKDGHTREPPPLSGSIGRDGEKISLPL